MSSALFGSNNQQGKSKTLVEFKAGKMILKNKMLNPDNRKGLVYVYQSEDSLMHFCWKDRTNGIVEDDLILFPDDVETKRLNECTTGRVYLMKFKSSNKKFFFWMQETDTDKDEKLWKKVNDLFNSPPTGSSGNERSAGSGGVGSSSSAAAGLLNSLGADFGGSDLQNMLGSMNEQQLQMFLNGLIPLNSPSSNRSGSGSSSNVSSNQTSRAQSAATAATPSAAAAATASAGKDKAESKDKKSDESAKPSDASSAAATTAESQAEANKKIQMSDLQKILGNLNPSDSAAAAARFQELDLSEVINMEVMAPILANKEIQERLMKHMPESEILPKTEHELKTTLTGIQFKKAMHSFGRALQQGQLGTLLKQFNLPEPVVVAAAQGNLIEFAKAMEEHCKKPTVGGKTESKEDDEENKMDTK